MAGAVAHPTADWASARGLCLQVVPPSAPPGSSPRPSLCAEPEEAPELRRPHSKHSCSTDTQDTRTRGSRQDAQAHHQPGLSQVPGAPLRLLSRELPAAACDCSEDLSPMPPAGSEPRRTPAGTRQTHCGEGFGTHQRPTSGVAGVQAAVGWRSPWGEQSLPRPTRVRGHHAGFTPESGLSSECSKDSR